MIGLSFSSLDKFPYHQTMQYKPFQSHPTRAAALLLALGTITWPSQVSGQASPGAPQNPAGQTGAPGATTLPAGQGAPTAEAPPQPPTEAEKLIDQAIKKVASYTS